MEFEWDQDKSDACFTERGFDFAYVLQAFMDAGRMIHKDSRWNYGEDHQVAWCHQWAIIFCCVHRSWNGAPDNLSA